MARNKQRFSKKSFPIVGIGASAGGLEAMTDLLKHLPGNSGLAFALVQHLDPSHESAMASLLARVTEMPVSEAKNHVRLQPNHFYVIPPNKLMSISQRRLKLSPRKDSHLPIDEFLRTLADEEGHRAIGVILSGNASDGTEGCRAIKAAGGITFAQEAKSAKYPGMPNSAIAAGCVDFVLPPDRIAQELLRIAGHPYVLPVKTEEDLPAAYGNHTLAGIFMTLRQRTGVDFSQYKHATLQRRIQRRMVLHKLGSLKEYADYLVRHANEVKELYSDILIHVTGFFRDPVVFQALKKKVFPRIFKGRNPDDQVRIWVPGCSTGEEAYSIAMAFAEFMHDCKRHNPVQIFGTDIHELALEKARTGIYAEGVMTGVSDERRRRFFAHVAGGFRINKTIREMCIFARQNLVTDPPFSNLDLVSCRNVLIYLGQPLQRKVMPVFHYALKPDGFLVLGASESVGGFAELFSLFDNKTKMYTRKDTRVRPLVAFARSPSEPATRERLARLEPVVPDLADIQRQADRVLLSHFSPAGVVINKDLEVLQFRGHTGLFLEHFHGEASLNLLKMAREELTMEVRTAVSKAVKNGARTRQTGARVKQNGSFLDVSIEVIPFAIPPSEKSYYLVLFQPQAAMERPKPTKTKVRTQSGRQESEVKHLREELDGARESMQAVVEEQEATTEELRSANEEIMSSNEELQSTNEELETAKEELQSTNEELTTLNDELEDRNRELGVINNDLQNILSTINIPILILSSDLKIRRFNPAAERAFNLIPTDQNRPITDIHLPLEIANVKKVVAEVMDHLTLQETEVRDRDGHWWLLRVRPYKTTDQKIDGAVLTLLDIHAMKTSADALQFADAVINSMPKPVLLLDDALNVKAANQRFYDEFRAQPEETLNLRIYDLGNSQWDIPELRRLLEEILPGNSRFDNYKVRHSFPRIGEKEMKLDARRLTLKGDKHYLILLTIENVT